MKDIMSGKQELTENMYEEMMEEWQKGGDQMLQMNKMMEEWGKTWEMEEKNMALNMPVQKGVIIFEQQNHFMEEKPETDLLARAKALIEEGRIQEAILCLEAEVQRNKQSSEAWRILGQLYQEGDQDEFAILAFRAAHEADPYDIDSLLLLGISCTNELDETEAQSYFHQFLKYHPDYSQIPVAQLPGPLDYDQVRLAFEEAHRMKPQDCQVLLALGVLKFIQRDYMGASMYFAQSIKINPTDHSLWNKYGACFANSLNTKKAIECYEQALDLRPNYIRGIANIGLAHNNLTDFKAAANCFLNVLMLNPKLEHVWTYVRTAFLQMNRWDLLEKLESRDPSLFADEFILVDPKNIQKPSMDKLYSNELFHE